MKGNTTQPRIVTRSALSRARRPWWVFDMPDIPAPLARYISGVCLLGALILIGCLVLAWIDPYPRLGLNFLAILALYVATNLVPEIPVNRGGQKISYRFHEFSALVGLAVGPAYLVPLAALTSEALHLAKDWRDRPTERFKIPFNAAHVLIVVAITVAVGSLGGPPMAYVLAAISASVASDLMIGKAMALAGGPRLSESLVTGWQTRIGIPTAVALLTSALLLIPVDGKITLALVPTFLLLAYKGTDEWVRMSRDRDQWRRMDQISSALVGQFDEQTIVRQALTKSIGLFGVRRVEILLAHDQHLATLYSIDQTNPSSIRATPLTGDDALCPDRADAQAEVTALTTTVPLATGDSARLLGRLTLHWSKRGRESDQRAELTSTLAHTLASNLLVAYHHEQVRQQAEDKAYKATHDTLTDLGNRAMLYERGPAMLADAAAAGKTCAIFVFDLDGFKRINDTLGHAAGDHVLVEVAKRIRKAVRRTDLAVRLGGDEFAVLATDMALAADAEMVVAKLLRALSHSVEVEGMKLTVEASIGIAVQGQDGDDIETLLRLGDVAMYEAKSRGHGQAFRYQATANSNTPEQLALAADLRAGLVRDEVVLHYQPQVNLATGDILGMEALARWQHPTKGLLFPDRFIPLTEHSGLIHRFTVCVIEQAVRDHARLRQIHGHEVTMSVNLSARNLLDQSLPGQVADILARHGVPAAELVLEITETIATTERVEAGNVVSGLAALGCQISLDDFGTGYSTLADLRRNMLLSEVKVDREFTAEITAKDDARVMVDCIVQMAHVRGCRVVAEGVEDRATMDLLATLGCDAAQGYHLARPMPLDAAEDWCRDWAMASQGVLGSILARGRG